MEGKLSSKWGDELELEKGSEGMSRLQEPEPTYGEHQPGNNCSSRPYGYPGIID